MSWSAATQAISYGYDIAGIEPNADRRTQTPESSRFQYVRGVQAEQYSADGYYEPDE